jgi:outer membrane immunogenic protein
MKTSVGLAIALGFVTLTSAATAADLPLKAPPLAPMLTSWTGFYAGINGGGVWTNDPSMTYTDLANTGNTFNSYVPTTVKGSGSSGLAGFHVGYNWQNAPNWVVGIEGDWDWVNLSASGTNSLTRALTGVLLTDNAFLDTKTNSLASVRGRLGYASNNWLWYATGGVAFANMDYSAHVTCTAVAPSLCTAPGQQISTQFRDTRVGPVVGGGVEFKQGRNWVFGVEYLYYHFGDTSTAGGSWFVTGTGAPAPFYDCTTAGQNCAKFSYGAIGMSSLRARLSYQFN